MPNAELIINTTPPNSMILIDGESLGVTDEDGSLNLPSFKPGTYTVSVSKAGYLPSIQEITLSAGRKETLTVELMLGAQALSIVATPPQSEVYIDDVLRGTTDASGKATFADVAIGEHRVLIRKPRYRDAVYPLSLSPDKEGQINANLELAVGFLSVTTNVANAGIDIAGVGKYSSPVSKVEVQTGSYTVTASSPLYVTQKREVNVSSGHEDQLSVTLEVDIPARNRLTVTAMNAFSRGNDFYSFMVSAKQVIDVSGSMEFNLQHHDFVMPGLAILQTGERIHRVKLMISATSISFDPQVNQEAECSFRKFSVPIETLSSVQVDETGGGLFKKVAGVYLKMELPNPTNPKKPYTLNFVDSTSAFVRDTRGTTAIRSRTEASQALNALSQVIRYASTKAR
ncbi:MAG: PEGA domain-containing protein [Acidobacteria bacterium]|nr:PEGA domain-containing protein [Acidobacteriota bacterium]